MVGLLCIQTPVEVLSSYVKFRFLSLSEVEKELGKKGKKATFGSIQQAPELPTKTRTLRKNMDNRDGDSPGKITDGWWNINNS